MAFTDNQINLTAVNDITYAAVILENMAIDIARANAIARNLWTQYSLVGKPSLAQGIPIWSAMTAASKSEGADQSNYNALTTTTATVTASVGAALMLTITDEVLSSTTLAGELAPYARQMGLSIADKIDADCMPGTSPANVVGTTGVDLALSDMEDARYYLANANAPGQVFSILAPIQVADLRRAILASGSAVFSDPNTVAPLMAQNQRRGLVGGLFGIPIYESTNVPATSTTDRHGFMGCAEYGGFAIKWDVRIEPQRDASAAVWELNGTACYGFGEVYDTYGVEIQSDY